MPTHEPEHWRYTPIAELDLAQYTLADPSPRDFPARSSAEPGSAPESPTITLHAGYLISAPEMKGVTISTDREPDWLPLPDRDATGDMHDAFVAEVVTVVVAAGTVVIDPLTIMNHAGVDGKATFPHVVIDAGANSEVTVIEVFVGENGDALTAPVTELHAGEGANVRYVAVQDVGLATWSLAHLLTRAGRDANVDATFASLGGRYGRCYVRAEMSGVGGRTRVAGVYFGEGDQVMDVRSVQEHTAARAVSTLLLKGAVTDRAQGVSTGVIRVGKGARATESFLTYRNLVLGDDARVHSVPNLEIVDENDLRSCGHAAATEPVDPDHLFYLESRGVPTPIAERLVVAGFFDEVVASMPVAAIRDRVRAEVARRLERVSGA